MRYAYVNTFLQKNLRFFSVDRLLLIVYNLYMSSWDFRNVYIRYNYGATAIADCNFSMQDGEKVAIVGDCGSGKTSLMLAMAGLIPVSAGAIIEEGEDIANLSPKLRNILYVPDRDALFFARSVRYNLTYPLKKRGVNKEDIDAGLQQALTYFGLEDYADKIVARLPKYLQACVVYARMLMREVDTYIIDDYYSILPQPEQQKILNLIVGIVAQSHKTVAMATKDYQLATTFADTIVYLKDGNAAVINRDALPNIPDTYDVYRLIVGGAGIKGVLQQDDMGLYVEAGENIYRLSAGELLDNIFIGERVIICPQDGVVFDFVTERKIFG